MNAALKDDILSACQDDDYDYKYQEDNQLLKSVHAISLGDIMGEDHDIWIKKNDKFGFDIEIENENSEVILIEKGIHPYALESLADFARGIIRNYNRLHEVVA